MRILAEAIVALGKQDKVDDHSYISLAKRYSRGPKAVAERARQLRNGNQISEETCRVIEAAAKRQLDAMFRGPRNPKDRVRS